MGRLSIAPVRVTAPVMSHAGACLTQQICSQAPSLLRAVKVNMSPALASPITSNPWPGPPRKFSASTATTALKSLPGEAAGMVAAAGACSVAVGEGG